MPSGNDKVELLAQRQAFEARTIENAASAIEGALDARYLAVVRVSYVLATQHVVKAWADGTTGKADGAAPMNKNDIKTLVMATMAFNGRAIEKGAQPKTFASMSDAIAYARGLDARSTRNSIKDFFGLAFKVAGKIVKLHKQSLVGCMQKHTEDDAFYAYAQLVKARGATVAALEDWTGKTADPKEKPKQTLTEKIKATLDKGDFSAEEIAAAITALNAAYAEIIAIRDAA
jgi:hypothetical protein